MVSDVNARRLERRLALVTGGSKGIGRAITCRLLQEGAHVVACGRNKSAFEGMADPMLITVECDVTDIKQVKDLADFFSVPSLDILVNNVGGVSQFGILDEMGSAEWQQVFNENMMSTVNVTNTMLPLLKTSGSGSIINIASVAGVQAGYFNGHYGSMKAAQIHYTKYLANNYGKYGIRANVVCPSTIKGGVWERDVLNKSRIEKISYTEAEQQLEKEVKAKSVLGRIGTPEDVAAAVAFLASDDARMITGSCINVDGGTVRSI